MTPIESLENRLWQGGFRFVAGRDGEFYALPVHDAAESDALNISPLVRAYRAGYVTVGHFLAECCRLIGLPEFDVRDWTGAENDA
jgi:hypothetical protein